MCLDMAGRLMSKCSANEFIVRLSFKSSRNICLRLGSATTWNTSKLCCFTVCSFYKFSDLLYVFEPSVIHGREHTKIIETRKIGA